MECSICKKTVDDNDKFCPYCGTEIEVQEEANSIHQKTDDVLVEKSEAVKIVSTGEEQQDISFVESDISSREICSQCNSKVSVKKGRCSGCAKKNRIKIIICGISMGLILAIGIFAFNMLKQQKIIRQDITAITGCPEFYDIQWDMDVDTASSLIKMGHKSFKGFKTVKGYENEIGDEDSYIYTKKSYNLYGLKTSEVYCGFNVLKLNSVIIKFSKDKTSLDQVVKLYSKIYGEPTESNKWKGSKTTIDIWDNEVLNEEDKFIIVRYKITENSQYTMLSLDGTETDPFGLTDKNRVFGKKANDFIKGLIVDEDYIIDKNSYYTSYTLLPSFVFMGVLKSDTAIKLYTDPGDNTINLIEYLFYINADQKEQIVSTIENIKDKFDILYGNSIDCSYASMILDGSGQKNISFDEIAEMVNKGTQGIYNIQWSEDESKITLGVTINSEKDYITGSVAYTD